MAAGEAAPPSPQSGPRHLTANVAEPPAGLRSGHVDLSEDFPSFDTSCLTAKQADCLAMRYRGDLSYREMARLEGVYPNAIWERHRWALRKLAAQMAVRPNLSSREPNAYPR